MVEAVVSELTRMDLGGKGCRVLRRGWWRGGTVVSWHGCDEPNHLHTYR